MKQTLTYTGALLALLTSLVATAGGSLEISDPWIREAPPGTDVLAAYLVIRNHGDHGATVSAISSPDFERVEVHRTLVEDGVARMIPVPSLQIASQAEVSLEPGGMHLMLYRPRRPLRAGDRVALDIEQPDAACIRVMVPVLRMPVGDDDHGDHHHHHH